MTTTWGGTAIPDPEGWDENAAAIGAQFYTADGALNTHVIKAENTMALRWSLITRSEKNAIKTLATTYSAADLVLPVAYIDTRSVIPLINTWTSAPVGGASTLWRCSCTVRTVT